MAVDPQQHAPTPVDAASVLVVADRPTLEVMLLHRRPGSDFVGGMVVFPGGAVDESDRGRDARRLLGDHIDPAARAAGVTVAHVVAAVRETLEESGLWLGRDPTGPVEARSDVDSGVVLLVDVAVAGSLSAAAMPHAGRWVTPPGGRRRYDTHFFVARADPGVVDLDALQPDGREVVDLEWATPAGALDRIATGHLAALSPTVTYLRALARYQSVDAVMAAARLGRRIDHERAWITI